MIQSSQGRKCVKIRTLVSKSQCVRFRLGNTVIRLQVGHWVRDGRTEGQGRRF